MQKENEQKQLPQNNLKQKSTLPKLKFNIVTDQPYIEQQIQLLFNNPWPCKQNLMLYPAYQQSFVLGKQGNCKNIYHLKKNGNIIKSIQIGQLSVKKIDVIINKYAMINVYDSETKSYLLFQWNLVTNQLLKFTFQDKIQNKQQNKIFATKQFTFFSQSNLMCIQQVKNQVNLDKKTLKHHYYQLPLKNENQKCIYQKDITQYFGYFRKKINNKSQYAFITKLYKQQYYQICISGLRDKQQKQNKIYKLQTKILKYDRQFLQDYIIDIWQPIQGNLYIRFKIQIDTYKISKKYGYNFNNNYQQKVKKAKQVIQEQKQIDLIWQYRQNKYTIINQTYKFDYILQFTNGLRQISQFVSAQLPRSYYDDILVVKCAPSTYKQCNIFYYNFYGEQVVAVQEAEQKKAIRFKANEKKICFPLNDIKIYMKYNWELKQDGKYIGIKANIKKIMLPELCIGETLTLFLIEIIKNCDEDLLRQVINLVSTKQ